MSRNTMGGLLIRMFRERTEWANGRISKTGGCWYFDEDVPKRFRTADKRIFHGSDADGRAMSCVGDPGVQCFNPVQQGRFPHYYEGKRENWYVPYRVCRACECYRPADRSIRYPHCQYALDTRGGLGGAVKEVTGVIVEARQMVDEMLQR